MSHSVDSITLESKQYIVQVSYRRVALLWKRVITKTITKIITKSVQRDQRIITDRMKVHIAESRLMVTTVISIISRMQVRVCDNRYSG